MESLENILPREQTLDEQIALQRYGIDALIDSYRENNGDIISPDHEAQYDLIKFGLFCDTLADELAHDELDRPSLQAAIYRSICFADQIAREALPDSHPPEMVSYLVARLREPTSLDGVIRDAEEYLHHRVAVDSFLAYYMPEIDVSGQFNHVVEIFSSLVFMLAERSTGEQYLAAELEELTPEAIIDRSL